MLLQKSPRMLLKTFRLCVSDHKSLRKAEYSALKLLLYICIFTSSLYLTFEETQVPSCHSPSSLYFLFKSCALILDSPSLFRSSGPCQTQAQISPLLNNALGSSNKAILFLRQSECWRHVWTPKPLLPAESSQRLSKLWQCLILCFVLKWLN